MAPDQTAEAQRTLQVHAIAWRQLPERGPRTGLRSEIEPQPLVPALHHGEAHAVDGDAGALRRIGRAESRRRNQTDSIDTDDVADFLDETGEHAVTPRGPRPLRSASHGRPHAPARPSSA